MDKQCSCEFVINVNEKCDDPHSKHYQTCMLHMNKRLKDGEFPNGLPRDENGFLKLINPHLQELSSDVLYHIALDTKTHNLKQLFGDVKFVCMGGTTQRMEELAKMAAQEFGIETPSGCGFIDMAAASHRYCLYKVGPIISVNHGVGMSTMSVVLQEIIKVLQYSGARDPIIFRVGTSGGINVKPGTVVISNKAYNGMLQQTYDLPVLGKLVSWPAIFDECLAEELEAMAQNTDSFSTIMGGTMGANDFYNGQGRTDGAFCEYSNYDKMKFLLEMRDKGIKNVEMEAPCFAALTHRAGIKAGDVCVTIVDRLQGDQVTTTKDMILEYQMRPMKIIFRYIKTYLKNIQRYPYGKC